MFKGSLNIGSMDLEIETQNMKEVFKWSTVYGNLPENCDACKSADLFLSFKAPKGHEYYSIKCRGCGAEANFGQHREGGGLYFKGDPMTVYKP